MTPVNRVRLFFLIQFMGVGMVNAYGGPWLDSRGLTSAQIGLVNAIPIAFMMLLTVPAGRLADKASDWRVVIVAGMVAAAIVPFGFFFVSGFIGILVVWTLAALAQALTIPVIDGAGLRFGRRNGVTLGGFRALSTIGYLAVILLAGPLLGDAGMQWYLPLLVGFGLLRAAAALGLPRLRAPEGETVPTAPVPIRALRRRWFLLPCLGAAILLASGLVLNGFQALLWSQNGMSAEVIGRLIALGAGAEAILFLIFGRIAHWASPARWLLIASGVTVVRWILLGLDLPVPALIFIQMMHAFTYGVAFLASANFIADNTGEEIAASAQAALVVTQQGLAIVFLTCFGWIAGQWGLQSYFALAVIAAVGMALIALAGPVPEPEKSDLDG